MSERIQRRLGVQRIEAGLEQQQIHTAVYQPSDLQLKSFSHLIK